MAKWRPGGPGRPPANAAKRAGRPRKARVGRPRKNAAARELGARGGRARTAKQTAARKRNARFAGRPAKVCIHCGKPAKGGHKIKRYDASCGMHGWMYRQHTDTDPLATRQAINDEILALQRLLVSLEAAHTDAAPEHPEEIERQAGALPPQQEPEPEPEPAPEPKEPEPAKPELRLDPATLTWREPEENKPAESNAVPF